MARIRSIKPEYTTDGSIDNLSDSCALFFVALWGQCDDFGYFTWSPRELHLKLPRWTAQSISAFISKLAREGLVATSRQAGVGLVTGWDHQKIKDRRASKWNGSEITWDEIEIDAPDTRKNRPKDRIGEERIGRDRISFADGGGKPATKALETRSARSPNGPTWEAYRSAYFERYRTEPVRNAKVNSHIAQIVQRLGADEAPDVATFYVWHNDAFYVRQTHPVSLLLKDCESLRTQWALGRAVTGTDARSVERMQNNANAFAVFSKMDKGGAL